MLVMLLVASLLHLRSLVLSRHAAALEVDCTARWGTVDAAEFNTRHAEGEAAEEYKAEPKPQTNISMWAAQIFVRLKQELKQHGFGWVGDGRKEGGWLGIDYSTFL